MLDTTTKTFDEAATKALRDSADRDTGPVSDALGAILRYDIDVEPADYLDGDDYGAVRYHLDECVSFARVAPRQQVRIADWREKQADNRWAALLAADFFARCPNLDPVALKVGVRAFEELDDDKILNPGYVDVAQGLMIGLLRFVFPERAARPDSERAELLRDLLAVAAKAARSFGHSADDESRAVNALVGGLLVVAQDRAEGCKSEGNALYHALIDVRGGPRGENKIREDWEKQGAAFLDGRTKGLLAHRGASDLSDRADRASRPGISIQEAAEIANRDEATITRWCKSRGIGKKAGGRWVVSRKALDRTLNPH